MKTKGYTITPTYNLDLLRLYYEFYKRSKLYSKGETWEEFKDLYLQKTEFLIKHDRAYEYIFNDKTLVEKLTMLSDFNVLKKMMKECTINLKEKIGRTPDAYELIEEFTPWLKFFLKLPVKKDAELEKLEKLVAPRKHSYRAMKRYIAAYDLKEKGKTIQQIASVIYPGEAWCEDVKLRDIRKAKQIITNVENFEFPGKYK